MDDNRSHSPWSGARYEGGVVGVLGCEGAGRGDGRRGGGGPRGDHWADQRTVLLPQQSDLKTQNIITTIILKFHVNIIHLKIIINSSILCNVQKN